MATDLTGLQVRNTYNSLLKIGDNTSLTGIAKRISDGLGNDSPLFISTSQISIGVTPATGYDLTVNSGIRTGSIDVLGAATAQSLQFTGGGGTQGTMSWNTDEETVDLIQNGATLQLGQETHVHVKNQSGATINDGTPVYVTGTLGASGRLTVAPMIADGSIEAKYFLGVTTEDIPNGEDGKVTTFGKIRGLNTSAYAPGTTLYVSSTTAGFWQTTPPVSPALDLEVAIVINQHANNGTLFVRAQNGQYLGLLHDVYLNSVADNQLLVYNATNSRWENQGIASIGAINLDTVTDNGNTTNNSISVGDINAGNVTLTGYLRGAANFVIDPAAHGDETGVVQILGDLRVDGTTTTINSTTVTINDKNIVLAQGSALPGDANGAGITIDGASATMIYNSTSDRFVFNKDIETGNITTNSITGDSLNINATTQIDLKYDGSTQLRIDQFGVAYLGTVTFANDGISLTDEDSTTDSFFHANIDYDAGLYQVVSNTRYGSDYIQVDGLDTRDRTRFAFSPKETTTINPTLYIGGGYSATSPNTLDDWYDININTTTLDISATSVSSNANISAPTFIGDLQGNADTASTWENARTITIGDTGKNVNGGSDVTWTRTEIGITKTNIDALGIDADTLDGFNSTSFNRKVYEDSFGNTPETRWYVITLPHYTSSGWSQYYYFDVIGTRDISSLASQLHYRVYLHSRGVTTDTSNLDADVLAVREQDNEFFTFAAKNGGSGSNQFYIEVGEDYSRIQIIAYPSGENLVASMIASQDTEPTGFTSVSVIQNDLQTVTDKGATTTNTITASGGINGLTLTNGISGTNFNISGVNQLEIADPGEGIVFKSGSSGDMVLAIVDDTNDNRLDFSGTNAAISVNSALLATQSWVQNGIETKYLLIDSGGSDTPLGQKYIYRIGNSSSDGSTWKKVCDVNIPTGLYAAVSMDIVFYFPNTNFGDSASLAKYHYSAAFRRSNNTQDGYNDALLYGYNSNYIRIVKTATGDYELQTRANTNNRGIFVEYVITGGNPDWITPTTSVVNGSTTGTIYAASVNTTFKTLTGGSISANEFEVNANLLVDSSRNIYIPDGGKLNLGNSSDSTIYHNGSNAYFDSATGSMFIRNFANDSDIVLASDDGSGGIDDYIRLDGSEGSVLLYHYGSTKLETTATGVSVTGALSGNISTSSISGGTIDINGTTAINLQYNGTTQLRIDSSGVDYLGTVSFSNDGISLTDEDSTTDSFFHANVDYDAGLYTVTSNARYGADYIQVDGLDSREDVSFTISPKDIGDPDPHAYLYIGGDNSITAPNTLVDWHTIEMNALSVQINNNEVATQTWVNTNTLNQTEGDLRYLQLSGGSMTGNITFGQGDKIIFPDNTSVPDNPSNQQVDYITFGSQGSISQVSGRGALMITSSDDSLILANGDVGRFFTNNEINVGVETTYLLSDGDIELYSDLQDGWDGSPTPWYRLRYGGGNLTTYDGTNTYTYWNSNDDAEFNTVAISGGTSSQFLKADGSVDSSTYLTSYTETDTLQSVTNRGASTTNGITITNDNALVLRTTTAGAGAKINFSDQATALQNGTLRYVHVDTDSYGSGNAFILESTEASLTVLADGKLMYKDGLYIKPSTGTGGGTLVIDADGDITARNITGALLRLTNTTDASVSSTGHAFQVGADSAANIIMDSNEIMARNNGAVSGLNFNPDGGDVTFHNNTTAGTVNIGGNQVLHAGNFTSYTDPKYLRSNTSDTMTGTLTIVNAAVPMIFNESGNTGDGQWWRHVLDGGNMRWDVSTSGGSGFTTYNAPLRLMNTGDVFMAYGVGIGTTSTQIGQLTVNAEDDKSRIIISRGGTTLNPSTSIGTLEFYADYSNSPIQYATIEAYANGLSGVRSSLDFNVKSTSGNILTGMTVYGTSSGVNIGIGDSSPSEKLDVAGKIRTTGRNYSYGQLNHHIELAEDSGSGYIGNINRAIYMSNGSYFGAQIYNVDSTQTGLSTIFLAANGDTSLLNDTFTAGVTTKQGSTRMIVKGDTGRVGIGTVSPAVQLSVTGTIYASGGSAWNGGGTEGDKTDAGLIINEGNYIYTRDGSQYLRRLIGKNTGDVITIGEAGTSLIDAVYFYSGSSCSYRWHNNTSVVMELNSTGLQIGNTNTTYALDVTGTIRASSDIIAFSDARVKENVKTIDNALDKVTQLRGVSYNKIGETEEKIGVIAQEIEKVLPQVVQEDNEGMKSVAYGNIVGVLIEAIKEQQKQIDKLKARLDA
jgi:lipopolysaccharide export system protein LptA